MSNLYSDNLYVKNLDVKDKKIWDHLQDDESRDIFIQRYRYYLDGDENHLSNMLRASNDRNRKRPHGLSFKNIWQLLENAELRNKEVVIYGAGGNFQFCRALLEAENIRVGAVCDSIKHGGVIDGLPIISPENLLMEHRCSPIVVSPLTRAFQKEIYNLLISSGFQEKQLFFYGTCFEQQYFSTSFTSPVSNEVYIDGGCFGGETILDFVDFAGSVRGIYGFEPVPECYARTVEMLRKKQINHAVLFQKGLWNSSGVLRFDPTDAEIGGARASEDGSVEIETTTIDEVINPADRVTFIKLDIEGSELNALKGGAKTIRASLPRLAICVYHKPEDIVAIPDYILSLSPNYKLYLRHHSWFTYNETVLYAVQ